MPRVQFAAKRGGGPLLLPEGFNTWADLGTVSKKHAAVWGVRVPKKLTPAPKRRSSVLVRRASGQHDFVELGTKVHENSLFTYWTTPTLLGDSRDDSSSGNDDPDGGESRAYRAAARLGLGPDWAAYSESDFLGYTPGDQ